MHPYTKVLISHVPVPDPKVAATRKKNRDKGRASKPNRPSSWLQIRSKCPFAKEICFKEEPELRWVNGRMVACHLV